MLQNISQFLYGSSCVFATKYKNGIPERVIQALMEHSLNHCQGKHYQRPQQELTVSPQTKEVEGDWQHR